MEFRQLVTEAERSIFAVRLETARSARAGFRENSRCHAANCRRLACSRLYGLFEDTSTAPQAMVAGIAMHDLQAFPQSCSEPDLSQYPPTTVVECSDHWSLSNGAGMLAWVGLAMPIYLLGVRSVLAYLAAGDGDSDHASFYASMGFVHAGRLVAHPFVESADGANLLVQPVLLRGSAFDKAMSAFSKACVEYSGDARIFKLRNFIRPLIRFASSCSARSDRKHASASTMDGGVPVQAAA
jgi:hypothetical protein